MAELSDPRVVDIRSGVETAAARRAALVDSAAKVLAANRSLLVLDGERTRPPSGLSRDTEAVLHSILRATRDHFGLDAAFISHFRDGRRFLVAIDAMTIDLEVGDSDPLEDTYCARVVDGRLPQVLPDAREDDEARSLPVTESLDVRAHLSVPLELSNGALYGTFCCFGSRPALDLGAGALRTMKSFAQLAAEALERDEEVAHRLVARSDEIRRLIDEDRIRIHYQPIVDLTTGRAVGYEALSRFDTDPVRPPDEWFRRAATAGLGIILEARAIELALAALDHIPTGCYLAVNASASTIESGVLPGLLGSVDPRRIVLELTEHDRVHSLPRIVGRLGDLRALGVRLSIDDTGTGYAGLHRLVSLSPEIIKLDRSLVAGVDHDVARQAMGDALASFASAIGAGFVAEGIETEPERRHLLSRGVAFGQGFLFGRPAPMPAPV